jgi:hypothetical protein
MTGLRSGKEIGVAAELLLGGLGRCRLSKRVGLARGAELQYCGARLRIRTPLYLEEMADDGKLRS